MLFSLMCVMCMLFYYFPALLQEEDGPIILAGDIWRWKINTHKSKIITIINFFNLNQTSGEYILGLQYTKIMFR